MCASRSNLVGNDFFLLVCSSRRRFPSSLNKFPSIFRRSSSQPPGPSGLWSVVFRCDFPPAIWFGEEFYSKVSIFHWIPQMKNQYSIFLCLQGCRLLFVTLKKIGKIFGSWDAGSMCAIFSRSARGFGRGVSGCDKKGKIVLQSNTQRNVNKPQIGISNSMATSDAQRERGQMFLKGFPLPRHHNLFVFPKKHNGFSQICEYE